jgi:hypothetical protein
MCEISKKRESLLTRRSLALVEAQDVTGSRQPLMFKNPWASVFSLYTILGRRLPCHSEHMTLTHANSDDRNDTMYQVPKIVDLATSSIHSISMTL